MDCVVTEASYFEDPFAPKAKIYSKSTSATSLEILKPRKSLDKVKVRPCIQHLLKVNTQIGSIKVFPSGEFTIVGSLDTIFCMNKQFDAVEMSVYFDGDEYNLINHMDVHLSEAFIACNAPENSVRVVSVATGSTVYSCNKHLRPISSVFFASSVNRICSSSLDGTFIMSDLETKKQCYQYTPFAVHRPISTASIRHDDSVIAFGFSEGLVGLCDNRNEGTMTELKAHSGWVNSIDFCGNDYYFSTCGNDRSVKIWDLRNTTEAVFSDNLLESSLRKVLFMNNGTFFTVSCNGSVASRNLSDGKSSCSMALKSTGVLACDIDPEARMLLYSGGDMVVSALHF